jgi:D-glycero-D-manno-heptose 1,7-bisphosphate phosphatase
MLRRGAFLDRDGVINQVAFLNGVPSPPKRTSDLVILDGVIEAIQILIENQIVPIVVTNQPDVARGTSTIDEVKKMNKRISELTGISNFYTCFHDDSDECICRKPKPGLLSMAAKDLIIGFQGSFLVGDRWRDISAGQKYGITCYFIDHSYPEKQPEMPYIHVGSLLEAVEIEIGDKSGAS